MTMRLHRFFVEQKLPPTGKVKIENDDLIHQWRHVLRFQVGQEVILFDNSGTEFSAVLLTLGNRSAEVEIHSSRQNGFEPRLPLFLFLSLAKRDSFEWTLEKGTELGVMRFTPVISERSKKKKVNLDRSKKIVQESCEQSGRSILPEVGELVSLEKALENLVGESFALDGTGEPLLSKYFSGHDSIKAGPEETPGKAGLDDADRINVFIGPEGGWSQAEIGLFNRHKIPVFSLGKQTLRAETAAVAIASILLLAS